MAEKRVVSTQQTSGLTTRDLILVAVLLAAGAVLKLTVSSFLTFAGMKPNFMIAMYCLAIILVRPNVFQAIIIGFLTGLISQIPHYPAGYTVEDVLRTAFRELANIQSKMRQLEEQMAAQPDKALLAEYDALSTRFQRTVPLNFSI